MSYHQRTQTHVTRMADGAVIPFDNGNADYREYLRWVAQGNQAAPKPVEQMPDLSDSDNLDKAFKAVMLVVAAWSGKTPAQARAAFKAAWDSLP